MKQLMTISALAICAVFALGCAQDGAATRSPTTLTAALDEPADPCDAGDESFVKRVIPLLWGRKPASINEVDVLVQVLQQTDRATLVRAMTYAPEYYERFGRLLQDHLMVARAAFRANPACYQTGLLPIRTPALAEFVRDNPANGEHFGEDWNMADLIQSSLLLDDVSPIFRAELFGQVGAAVITRQDEVAFRSALADIFQKGYLHRNLVCVACHNSETATTDSPDPALDRHFPMPGLFEKALWGASTGRPKFDLMAFFRVVGVLSIEETDEGNGDVEEARGPGEAPWGIAFDCGQFEAQADIEPDHELEMQGYLVEDHGLQSSVWNTEQHLAAGFTKLRDGLEIAEDGTVDGDEGLAYMVGASLAEAVWREVYGYPLTVANAFPRNAFQRDALKGLTDRWADTGYSLRELLVMAVLEPTYNQGAPADCGDHETAYYLPPVFNPWAREAADPLMKNNSAGDGVYRHPARTLHHSVVYAMGWSPPIEFFPIVDSIDYKAFKLVPEAQFQRDIGVFLKASAPGFNGIDFQSSLAWELGVGACIDPERFAGEFWKRAAPTDTVHAILAAAPAGATLRDAAIALKDRLITDPVLTDPTEQALVEALLGYPVDTPLSDVSDAEAGLRRLCGALLSSPQFLLAGYARTDRLGEQPTIVLPGSSFEELCNAHAATFMDPGKMTCTKTSVEVKGAE